MDAIRVCAPKAKMAKIINAFAIQDGKVLHVINAHHIGNVLIRIQMLVILPINVFVMIMLLMKRDFAAMKNLSKFVQVTASIRHRSRKC